MSIPIVFDWDAADDTRGNTRHVLDAGVDEEEFQEVVTNPFAVQVSRRKNPRGETRWIAYGYTSDGRYFGAVYVR